MKKLQSLGTALKRYDSGQRQPANSDRGERADKKPPMQKATPTAAGPEGSTPKGGAAKKKIFTFKNFNPLKSPMQAGAQSARIPDTESKKENKKRDPKKDKKKVSSSSNSSDESVGNVFPASLTGNHPPPHHTGETKQLFLKISYLEREN